MILKEIKEKISKNKRLLAEKYGVKTIGIFGSAVKNSRAKDSDIDILVEFSRIPDMFEYIKLEEFLSSLLCSRVDLVTKNALKPLIKEAILKETAYIWKKEITSCI